jgi:hypothetical protein
MSRMDRIGKTATTVTNDRFLTVRYHETDVVHVTDNKIILNTGGWRTVTTKARMNQTSHMYNLGFYVYQRNHEWFVEYKGAIIPFIYRELELIK